MDFHRLLAPKEPGSLETEVDFISFLLRSLRLRGEMQVLPTSGLFLSEDEASNLYKSSVE